MDVFFYNFTSFILRMNNELPAILVYYRFDLMLDYLHCKHLSYSMHQNRNFDGHSIDYNCQMRYYWWMMMTNNSLVENILKYRFERPPWTIDIANLQQLKFHKNFKIESNCYLSNEYWIMSILCNIIESRYIITLYPSIVHIRGI